MKEIFGEMKAREALARIMEPDSIDSWLNCGNPGFEGRKPINLIKEGEWQRIVALVDLIESDPFI